MQTKYLIWLVVVVVFVTNTSQAGSTNMGLTIISNYHSFKFSLGEPKETEKGFWQIMEKEVIRRGNSLAVNKFGPLSGLGWVYRQEDERYDIHQRVNKVGTDLVRRTLTYSLREMADGLPMDLDPVSPSSSIVELRLKNKIQSGAFQYGVRPFRTSPYGYFSANLGSDLTINLRLRSLLKDGGLPKAECHILYRIWPSWYAVFGTSLYPTEIGSEDRSPSAVFRIAHYFGKKGEMGTLYAGLWASPKAKPIPSIGLSFRF